MTPVTLENVSKPSTATDAPALMAFMEKSVTKVRNQQTRNKKNVIFGN